MSPAFPFFRVCLACCLFLLSSAAAGGASAQELSDTDRERLEAGEVLAEARTLEEEGAVAARVRAVIAAAPAKVWEHVAACDKYSEFMPRLSESRIVEQEGERVVCHLRIDMPFPLGALWSESEGRHRALSGGRFERRWKLLRGTYKRNEGHWRLGPWGEDATRTLVTYQVVVAPDKAIPQSILREGQRRSLPELIEALRRRVAE
jgi:ribosome-associated toxin RatA of RatAB toxin-antitoxin module